MFIPRASSLAKQVGQETRSPGQKRGQILNSPYLRQFLGYSVETKTEKQCWLSDIILLWLTSGVTLGLTLGFDIKMAAILIWQQKLKDHPKLSKKKYF